MPFQMYAQSGGDPGTEQATPLPGVSLNAPHRFRIEWNATNVALLRGRRARGHAHT